MRFLPGTVPIPEVSGALFGRRLCIESSSGSSPASTRWFVKVVYTLCFRRRNLLALFDSDYFRDYLTPSLACAVVSYLNNRLNKPDFAFSFFQSSRISLKLLHLDFSFQLLLKSLCGIGMHSPAKLIFEYMKADGISSPCCSSSDLNFIVTSFTNAEEFRIAQEILVRASESCCKNNELVSSLVHNRFLNVLMNRHRVDEAVKFFRDHILSLRGFRPDTFSFNIILRGLCCKGMVDKALEFFDMMREFDCKPDIVTFNTLVSGMCRVGDVNRAKELLVSLKAQYGLLPDVVTYTAVVSGLCKSGNMDFAEAVFEEMSCNGITPNSFTFNALIDGFGKKGDLASASRVFSRMTSVGIRPDVFTFTSLIDGHCRHGELEEGLALFYEMRSRQVLPTAFTYSVLIAALCKENRLMEARQLLRQMNGREDIPVALPFVYNPVIDGFCKSGNVDEANSIVAEMEAKGCSRAHDKMTFTILILGHCMKGRMVEAIRIYEKMVYVGCRPDDITWSCLVSCLRKAGMAREANRIERNDRFAA